MAKKKKTPVLEQTTDSVYPYSDKQDVLTQVQAHYQEWTDDNDQRASRDRGWAEITDAWYGKLPDNWPFISRTTDPRLRTTLIEKNARLTNRRLKGKVAPREGGDVIKARIQNSLLDYQWDAANDGGSMQTKISMDDMDSRLYGSKFGLNYWRVLKDAEGNILFEGNEHKPWNIMDCGMDPNCDHVRNARWFQHLDWMGFEDIEANKAMFPGYAEFIRLAKAGKKYSQKRRDSKYLTKIKQIKGLEDRMGTDEAFPVTPIVTEYRPDKKIIFSADYNVILGIFDNEYDHKKIPVSQLRYYPIDGDNLGESEVESVLPLWKAIQAVMCAFLDEVIMKGRPPLLVVEGAVRTETIVRTPDAQWLVDNPSAIMEMKSNGDSIQYFQNIYPVLVSAFNVAMGDMSQGTSNADPMAADKTATEIRQISKQQNSRDQKNQQELAEFIKDIVTMWMSNNRQFLFRDPKKHEYVLRIIGQENFQYFKQLGMDEMVLTQEASMMIEEIMKSAEEGGSPIPASQLQSMIDAAKTPKFPMIANPEEKDVDKIQFKPKMSLSEMGDQAEVSILPEDLEGMYDYVPDMKSMDMSNSEQIMFARTQAIQMLTNPNMLQLLQLQGYQPNIKDLMVANFEDTGLSDAQRFFTQSQPTPQPGQPGIGATQGFSPTGGTLQAQPNGGMGNTPQAPTQPSIDQQMAGPNQPLG